MTSDPETTYDTHMPRIARPSGAFAMVAMDQRESLRAMFAEHMDEPITLERRVAFKVAVARILSPHASALLLDAGEGVGPVLESRALAPGCGLIVAADELDQAPGEPVDDTRLDHSVDLRAAADRGAVGAKLLVIWRPDRSAADRVALVREFLDVARDAGLLGIVEPVVRPPARTTEDAWTEREAALLEAAHELGPLRPDVYKAQVPFNGAAETGAITEASARISEALPCPWVVLSSGVAIDAFPRAVEAACRGGASGFLAGRAVWRDAIGPDAEPALRDRSVPRLQRLGEVVDRVARPWSEAPRPV